MRDNCPPRPHRSWAAPMSITASGAPPAATVPATCTACIRRPFCRYTVPVFPGWPVLPEAPSAACAAGFRNTTPGARMAKRSAPAMGRGMRAGAICATTRASTPTTRKAVRGPVASAAAMVPSSSTGLASSTCGCCTTWAKTASSKLPVAARSSRSGCPFTERTAVENSSSADALIRCTENARATPSMTATTAAALRQGWWRSSCQEKVRSRAHMLLPALTGLRWLGGARPGQPGPLQPRSVSPAPAQPRARGSGRAAGP